MNEFENVPMDEAKTVEQPYEHNDEEEMRMLFVCIDGLKELEQGILSIFPQTHVQRCMVHLQRNSLKYIPTKHYKQFC